MKKKILSIIFCLLIVSTSVCTIFATDLSASRGTSTESTTIANMERITAPVDFGFEIVSVGKESVVAEFVSQSRITNPPYVGVKGTDITAETNSEHQYILDYDKEYSFVYSVVENEVETVYNSFLSVERGDNIKIVFDEIIKNVVTDEPTRAAGLIWESESNNTQATADITYDDYDNRGNIATISDVDWWKVSFTQAGRANFWLGDIPASANLNMRLFNSSGSQIGYSANTGQTAELIQYNVLPNTYYYVRIESSIGYSPLYYLFRVKNYPYVTEPTIPSNAIGVHVTDKDDNPIENAVVYVYKQKYQSAMYPQSPVVTDENGYAVITGLTTSGPYGVNVIANDYAAKSISEFVDTSSTYYEVVLDARSSIQLLDPISGFSPTNFWGHGGGKSAIGCTSICSQFTRVCPHEYMNVFYPQNFGWRYDGPSRLEFHQAIDVGLALDTPQYNVFPYTVEVTVAGNRNGCGLTVQLYCEELDLYATYMHLNSKEVIENGTVSPGEVIGYTGHSGTYDNHMHFSLATENLLAVSRIDTGGDIIDWTEEQIPLFVDPLAYIN